VSVPTSRPLAAISEPSPRIITRTSPPLDGSTTMPSITWRSRTTLPPATGASASASSVGIVACLTPHASDSRAMCKRAAVRASVATGENLTGVEQYRPLISAGAVDVVQVAAVWGVTHFLRVCALANAYDLPVSPIGNTPVALLHAATSAPNHIASELQNLQPPVGVSIELSIEDGAFVLGDSPGLGVKVDENAIAASAVRANAHTGDGPNVRPERAGRYLLVAGQGLPSQ